MFIFSNQNTKHHLRNDVNDILTINEFAILDGVRREKVVNLWTRIWWSRTITALNDWSNQAIGRHKLPKGFLYIRKRRFYWKIHSKGERPNELKKGEMLLSRMKIQITFITLNWLITVQMVFAFNRNIFSKPVQEFIWWQRINR